MGKALWGPIIAAPDAAGAFAKASHLYPYAEIGEPVCICVDDVHRVRATGARVSRTA